MCIDIFQEVEEFEIAHMSTSTGGIEVIFPFKLRLS
jgi:hypothetical protein